MTSLRKHIIPLQKDAQKLAFNIQSYDTIKYTPKNLASELERAIRDEIRITTGDEDSKEQRPVREKIIYRKLEVAGFVPRESYDWYLGDVIQDTSFVGFSNDKEVSILFLGKIDDKADMETYLEDLDVVVARTERIYAALSTSIQTTEAKIASLSQKERPYVSYDTEKEIKDLPNRKASLQRMERIYVAFIISTDHINDQFAEKIGDMLKAFSRYIPVLSEKNSIQLGDTMIEFAKVKDS